MKICLVAEHYPPHIGGVEIVFAEYAKHLAYRGHDVRVITSDSGGISGAETVENLTIHRIRCHSFFGHPLIPKSSIAEHVRWADIVHTTTYTASLPALCLAKKFKKPCLLTVHEAIGKQWFSVEPNPLMALGFLFFERFVIKRDYSHWHAISKATENDLIDIGIPKEKVTLIYNGIDTKIWNEQTEPRDLSSLFGFDPSMKVFLYNGRPGKSKGVFLLLDTIRSVRDKLPNHFRFGFILSKKPENERKRFEQTVREHDLGDIVRIHDPLPYEDLPGYRKAAYAFIVPSLTEGFGFTAAETSILDVPIISSDAGSLPEVVSGKVLFFKSGDSAELEKKIILAANGTFERISEKRFSWDESADKLESLYKSLL